MYRLRTNCSQVLELHLALQMLTLRIINLGEIMEENERIDSEKLANLMPLNQLALKLVDKPDTVGEIAVIETLHKRISATIIH